MMNEGEGYKYRGRGFLQLTGRRNYLLFSEDMNLPEVLDDPDIVAEEYAFETALWYFKKNGLFEIADKGVDDDTIKVISKRVNGGYVGLDDRRMYTYKIHGWLREQFIF